AADHLSRKAALQREPRLSIECSAALCSAISEVRTALRCRTAANPTLSDCGNTTATTTPTTITTTTTTTTTATTATSTTSPTVFRSCGSGAPSPGIVVLEQGGFVPAGLIGIDSATGDQCDFSSEGFLSNAIGANPNGVTLDPYGHELLVVDRL